LRGWFGTRAGRTITLAVLIVVMPGGFVLGGTMLTRRMLAMRRSTRDRRMSQ
jgi:hypothetical protein